MESTPAIGGSTVLHPSALRTSQAPRNWRQQAIPAAAVIAIGVLLFWQVDIPFANWLAASPLPKELQKLLEAAEHFGTVYGQLFIFAAIYALHPAYWQRGLATEMAQAAIAYAFTHGLLADIKCSTDEPNHASARVMARLGMRPHGRTPVTHADDICWDQLHFILRREDWRAAQ